MTSLDWIMLCVYLVVAVFATIRVYVCGVVGLNHTGNTKVEVVLCAIGLPVSIYLIIRHPWMCLLWFVVGSIVSICYIHIVPRIRSYFRHLSIVREIKQDREAQDAYDEYTDHFDPKTGRQWD